MICAILVFLCFALNWWEFTKIIWNSITGIFPSLDDVERGIYKMGAGKKFVATIVGAIVYFLSGILYGICALIIGAFSLLFPVIAGGIIFKISNEIFKSLFENNAVYPKTITAIYIIIILVLSGIAIKQANILPPNLLASFYQNPTITHSNENRVSANNNTKPVEVLKLSTLSVSAANIRSGPSTQYKILTIIKKGNQFKILSSKNGWSKIHFNGKDGYISNKLIQKVKN